MSNEDISKRQKREFKGVTRESYSKKDFQQLIASIVGQANILTIPRELIRFLDNDIEAALFLSQLIYWTERSQNDGYVAKTYPEWDEEIALSKRKLMRVKAKLERSKILETTVKKFKGSPTVHYRINYDKFLNLFIAFLNFRKLQNVTFESDETVPNKSNKMLQTITEITTETITTFPSPLPSSHKKRQKRVKHPNSEGRKDKGKVDKELFEKLRSGIYREDLFSIYDNLINIKTTEELTEDLAYKAIKSVLINNETFLRDKFNVTYNKFPFQETTTTIRKKFPYKKLPNGSDPDSRRNFFVAAICNTVAETLVDILEKKEPI